MPNLMPTGKQQYFYTGSSKPLSGGKIYTYAAGSSTPKVTYQDAAGTVPNTNPIVLDSTGSALIFWSGSYKVVVVDSMGNTVSTVDNYNTDPYGLQNIQPQLAAPAGADLIGYIATGTGAQKRSLLDRGRDVVSVFDYMTPTQVSNVRSGVVTDVTAAIQAAINSFTTYAGTVDLPPGNFQITAPLVTSIKGLRIRGASRYGTYLTAPNGATFDMIRIAHQQCEVSGIIFRPSTSSQVPIRIYAGRAYVRDNYLLAATNNAGIGILLTDTSPVDNSFVPGAYTHVIENNVIGDSGYAFANGITESSAQGITSTKFLNNAILSDRPIQINAGGANTYMGNLFQSSSGTSTTKTGVGLTFGTGVVGEKVIGNYFELFLSMVETRNTSATYQLFHAVANHNDNCNAPVADAGAKNYVIEDAVGQVENKNGWSTRYTPTQFGVNTPSAVNGFGMDTSGNCFMGAASGASHIINRPGSTENTVILNFQAAGTSIGYMQDARGTGINGANTLLALNKNSTTGRSINAAGTVNASGADYAEYMVKATGCGVIAKGQIIGITASDQITDKWANAVAFAVKSTAPSYVGGDTWFTTARPVAPASDASAQDQQAYTAAMQAWETAQEAARATVDRIAFCGRVPVNVLGATPGQYIVPVQDGDGIKGIAVSTPTLEQYMSAVGRVVSIDPDGRARVIVKSA